MPQAWASVRVYYLFGNRPLANVCNQRIAARIPSQREPMKVLVTGGAGFIGSHLVAELVRSDAVSIVVLDNLYRGRAPKNEAVHFCQADIRDKAATEDVMRGCDVVFHLAAQSNVMGAVRDSDYCFSSNVIGTYNVLESALRCGVKRVVFTSSREVYGDPNRIPIRETSPLRPKNAYGTSKVAGEGYCLLSAREGLEVTILRLTNVYGPGDRDRVIPLFATAAAAGEPLTVYGEGKTLDFVWIGTVIDALKKAGFERYLRHPVNIGSGRGVTITELAHRIVRSTGSSSQIRIVPERDQEVGRFVADITRGKRVLGLTEPEDPLWALAETLGYESH
jgi:nucleoside-diphosphate-sugar epimerase